jgi:hypothetical protein
VTDTTAVFGSQHGHDRIREPIRLGWADTEHVPRSSRGGDVIATHTLGAGDVHAVRADQDFAICRAAIVWPERPSRPPTTYLPSFACSQCQDLWSPLNRPLDLR